MFRKYFLKMNFRNRVFISIFLDDHNTQFIDRSKLAKTEDSADFAIKDNLTKPPNSINDDSEKNEP